jgi:multidrug resistance efflux pump
MSMRQLTLVLPVALAFGLVACDSRDYEAEITGLQGQLEEAQAELEAQRAENQTLTGEMEELHAQAGQAAGAAGGAGGAVSDEVRAQLETAMAKATQTAGRLAALEREPDAPAETRTEAVGLLRTDVQQIAAAVDAAASELGIDLEQAAVPAGDGGGQAQSGAAQEGQAQPPEPAAGPEGEEQPQPE